MLQSTVIQNFVLMDMFLVTLTDCTQMGGTAGSIFWREIKFALRKLFSTCKHMYPNRKGVKYKILYVLSYIWRFQTLRSANLFWRHLADFSHFAPFCTQTVKNKTLLLTETYDGQATFSETFD